jgi:hypothetical protein
MSDSNVFYKFLGQLSSNIAFWFSRSTALLFLYAEEADSGIVHENTVGMAVGRSHSIVGPRPKQSIVHYNLHKNLTKKE